MLPISQRTTHQHKIRKTDFVKSASGQHTEFRTGGSRTSSSLLRRATGLGSGHRSLLATTRQKCCFWSQARDDTASLKEQASTLQRFNNHSPALGHSLTNQIVVAVSKMHGLKPQNSLQVSPLNLRRTRYRGHCLACKSESIF